MYFRFAATITLVAFSFAASALAQQATVYDKSQDTRLDDIAKQLEALTARVTKTESSIAAIDRRIESLTTNVEKLAQAVADQDSRIKTLNETVNEITTRSNSELTVMKKQLDDISVKDGGGYVSNISSAMSTSDKFRQDMETAVNKSLKTGGSLLLTNKTAISQWVDINRTRHFLRPGEQLPVAVNVGTVTTQLRGEEMQTWTITAPAYQLSLDIVPKPAPTPTVVASPVYFGSPYFSPPLVETPISLGSAYSGPVEVAYR